MMAHRRQDACWLPSSTQLFAAALLLSACGVAFSFTSQPTSASASKHIHVIFAVGRMVQCRASQQASGSPAVTAAAQAVAQGRTPARADSFARAGSATAVVRAGCSLQLTDLQKPGRQWVAGPYTQAQELQISGVDVLDCLVHAEQQGGPTSEPPAYALLLRSTTTGPTNAFVQLEAVEYAQLAAQIDSNSTRTLLEFWLGGVSLPESCLTALHSHHQPNSAGAGAQGLAFSTGRQLRQDDTASDAAAAAAKATTNATTPAVVAKSTAATEQQTAESGSSSSSSNSSIATTNSGMNSLNGTSSSMNGTGAPEVLAQDQLLTDAANSTQAAANSSAPSNLTGASARVVCFLQPETGPCRASLKRWAFNVAAGGCKEFVYGGCRGNTNNFVSQQACEATCSVVMGVSPSPAVDVPPSGPMSVTVDDPRLLAGSSPAPPSSSAGHGRSWAEQLARVVLAGVVGVVMVLLL